MCRAVGRDAIWGSSYSVVNDPASFIIPPAGALLVFLSLRPLLNFGEACTIVQEDVAIPSDYLNLLLWAKDVALSLKLSLFTNLPKSVHCFITLIFKF